MDSSPGCILAIIAQNRGMRNKLSACELDEADNKFQ